MPFPESEEFPPARSPVRGGFGGLFLSGKSGAEKGDAKEKQARSMAWNFSPPCKRGTEGAWHRFSAEGLRFSETGIGESEEKAAEAASSDSLSREEVVEKTVRF